MKVFFATRFGWLPSHIEGETQRDLLLIVDAVVAGAHVHRG